LKYWTIFYNTVYFSEAALQIISGVYLVKSVAIIRRAYIDIEEKALNTCSLAVHAGAFGFYLASLLIWTISTALYTIF
jgi:hypothetical protein